MKIGVVGASGYSGGELLRLLSKHPEFTLSYIAAGSNSGELITEIHPQLSSLKNRVFEPTTIESINNCDLVFVALPHGVSAKLVAEIDSKTKIVDLGADFRLRSAQSWLKYYGGNHAGTWTYGLPELNGGRTKIAVSTRVANPGCYATAIAMAAAPAIASKLIDASDLVVVAASGTTGGGRSAKVNLLASEVMNSLTSYKFGGLHQHTPEIEETLSLLIPSDVKVSFTPILAPMPRGILATITAKLSDLAVSKSDSESSIRQCFETFYAGEEFVSILPSGQLPKTSSVLGSNSIQIQIAVDSHASRLVISAVIDNLGKGAASQAIQNANLMCGVVENAGLTTLGTP
jgi:N-acetyl-gamma-glutamyl-phosphate reductase